MNENLRKALLARVSPGQPHTDDAVTTINRIADVGSILDARARKLESDSGLTAIGRSAKLAELVRDELGRQYARASSRARKAPKYLESQRASLGLPQIDKTDVAGTMRRLELRTFLRDLPPMERYARAHEFAADPATAAAIFEQPASVSGLDDGALKMPQARVFEKLRRHVIERLHGPKLREIEAQMQDYEAVTGAAGAVRTELFKASGLTQTAFDEMMGPLEAAADGPPPAPRPASPPPSANSYQFDEEAFSADLRADFDRIWNEGMAKAVAETKAEMFGNSGGVK